MKLFFTYETHRDQKSTSKLSNKLHETKKNFQQHLKYFTSRICLRCRIYPWLKCGRPSLELQIQMYCELRVKSFCWTIYLSTTDTREKRLYSKIHILNKPDKYGLKTVVIMCYPKTYYMYSSIPYVGKQQHQDQLPKVSVPKCYILKITKSIYWINRNLFFFTTLQQGKPIHLISYDIQKTAAGKIRRWPLRMLWYARCFWNKLIRCL